MKWHVDKEYNTPGLGLTEKVRLSWTEDHIPHIIPPALSHASPSLLCLVIPHGNHAITQLANSFAPIWSPAIVAG